MTQHDRRGPAEGYSFGAKREYRRWIWPHMAAELGPAVTKRGHILMMPSIEGDEIEVAIRSGFAVEHIHVVDSNPAIVATLRRRWPRLGGTYGVDVGEACRRISASGVRLAAINLDLTGCLSAPTIRSVRLIGLSGAVVPEDSPLVAVTLLRGRERQDVVARIDEQARTEYVQRLASDFPHVIGQRDLTLRDWARVFILGSILVISMAERTTDDPVGIMTPQRAGSYLSPSGQTMLVAILRYGTGEGAMGWYQSQRRDTQSRVLSSLREHRSSLDDLAVKWRGLAEEMAREQLFGTE